MRSRLRCSTKINTEYIDSKIYTVLQILTFYFCNDSEINTVILILTIIDMHHPKTTPQPRVMCPPHLSTVVTYEVLLRNDLYCVEWDVKLYYTIPYLPYEVQTSDFSTTFDGNFE